jgi:hypothetical protein
MFSYSLSDTDASHTVTTKLQLFVTEINDNTPVMTGTTTGWVVEEMPIGTAINVMALGATDLDAVHTLTWSLSSSTISKFIYQTG